MGIQQQCSALTRMASKKKDLSDVTNKEALAHLEELFCKTCATEACDLMSHINISSGTVPLLNPETVLTTFCIFLSVASKVVTCHLPDVTMYKIQESLKRVEANIDKILAAPLKMATTFFKTIGTDIMTENYEDAFNSIQRLDSEATKAFYYADGSNISVNSFKECAKAAKLKMFAAILKGSYDRQEKVFLPPHKLPPNKVAQIGLELENIAKQCLQQRSNVKTTKLLMLSSSSKKSEVQDTLDSVLKMAYPYISEHKQLSSRKLSLANEDSIQFSVNLALLPMRYEDRTELVVGVVTDQRGNKKSVVKVHVWRGEHSVCYEQNSKIFCKRFTNETNVARPLLARVGSSGLVKKANVVGEDNVVDMSDAALMCSITLSASGTGAAAEGWASFLGRFVATGEVYQEAPVYRNSVGMYLYRHSDGTWRAGYKIGAVGGIGFEIMSVDTTAECPASISQWQYKATGVSWCYFGDITVKCSVHTLVTEGKTLVTGGKTLVTEGKTLVTEGKTLVTEGKTMVTKGKTLATKAKTIGTTGKTLAK